MIETKKQPSFGELLKIEAGVVGIEEWLRFKEIYDDVLKYVQAGVSPSLLFRTLRNNYGYGTDFTAIKILCEEHGPKESSVAVAAEVDA